MSGSTKVWRETLNICFSLSIMSAVFIRWNAFIAVSPWKVLCFSFQGGPQIVAKRFKIGAGWPGVRRDHPPQHGHLLGGVDRQRTDHVRAAHGDDRESPGTFVTANDVVAVQHVAGHLDVQVVLV